MDLDQSYVSQKHMVSERISCAQIPLQILQTSADLFEEFPSLNWPASIHFQTPYTNTHTGCSVVTGEGTSATAVLGRSEPKCVCTSCNTRYDSAQPQHQPKTVASCMRTYTDHRCCRCLVSCEQCCSSIRHNLICLHQRSPCDAGPLPPDSALLSKSAEEVCSKHDQSPVHSPHQHPCRFLQVCQTHSTSTLTLPSSMLQHPAG